MQQLKAQRIWFLWRKEIKDGRINKIPFAACGGPTGTNEKYRHAWVTYEEAVAAAEEVGAAGVGFVIPEGYSFWISTMPLWTIPECRPCFPVLIPTRNTPSAATGFTSMARLT